MSTAKIINQMPQIQEEKFKILPSPGNVRGRVIKKFIMLCRRRIYVNDSRSHEPKALNVIF